MCGIVGYIGHRDAYPVVLRGLHQLEYRGYDSAGICVLGQQVHLYKSKGDVEHLQQLIGAQPVEGTLGIGHTRWATHGIPNDLNAHPHRSMKGHFVLVHNGIIENYALLRTKLENRGYHFVSETDTEVLVNLIEYIYLFAKVSPEQAVQLALHKVTGAYGICVLCTDTPDRLIAARYSSPLVVGVGQQEYYVASDATPISEYTSNIIMLHDGDVAILGRESLTLTTVRNEPRVPNIQKIDWDGTDVSLGNFENYMLKEIYEQPKCIRDTCRGRIAHDLQSITLGGLFSVMPQLVKARRLIIVGCGTSWHAGLLGEYLIEGLARIPVEVEYASEFRYRKPIIYPNDIVLAISQSGETADTLAALDEARKAGALLLGICNVVGSSMSQATDAGVYTHAGPEIGVASTKAFTTQVTVLAMLAVLLGYRRGAITPARYHDLIAEIAAVPDKVGRILESNDSIRAIAQQFYQVSNFLYLGRGFFYPVALEGALKLKEISYIHAEGYPAAEMKHGPIALIDKNMPVVVLAGKDDSYRKVVSNLQEVKARKGCVIAIVSEGDTEITAMADYSIAIPPAMPVVEGILGIIPLQLLAYHIAIMRGCNVDRPRNLAKSVTVE